MDPSAGDNPERLLSSALRAQAAGQAGQGDAAAEPSSPPRSDSTPATPAPAADQPGKLPVAEVLLFALMLGLLAGGVVGVLSMS